MLLHEHEYHIPSLYHVGGNGLHDSVLKQYSVFQLPDTRAWTALENELLEADPSIPFA
jgi:hypothetical protein